MWSKIRSVMIILILNSVVAGAVYSFVNNKEKATAEQAKDCEEGGGYLIKSFRKKHEVWLCLTDFTEILVKESSE